MSERAIRYSPPSASFSTQTRLPVSSTYTKIGSIWMRKSFLVVYLNFPRSCIQQKIVRRPQTVSPKKQVHSFTIARLYCTYRECRVGYIATDLNSYPMSACTKQRRFKGSAPVALEPQPDFSRHTRFKSKVSIAPTPIYIASLKHTHIQAHTFLLPNTHILASKHTHIHVCKHTHICTRIRRKHTYSRM